jgi:uncharacterized protein YndB with AHSA1/START domain
MNDTSGGKPKFVYVTYIRTTAEKLWAALTKPEFTRQFWFDTTQECEWRPGSLWRLMAPDGRVADAGEVLEADPPRRLVLTWRHEMSPEMKAEGFSRLTYLLEQQGDTVKLTLTHEAPKPESKFLDSVSDGWPVILASLKSLLETGESLEATRKWPEGM